MLRRQRQVGAAGAVLVFAVMAFGACGSDDDGGGAGTTATTTERTEVTEADTAATEGATATSGPDVATEEVTFNSADGVQLSGRIYGTGTTAIVASHQVNRSKGDFAASGPLLADAGFMVLAYDNRNDGASGTGDPTQRVKDLLAAVDLVRSRGASKVFLLGASRGGALSLTGATQTPVDGVITISAPPPEEGPAAVSAVTVPSLYVNSENDDFAESTQAMYDAANEPRQLQMYPGGGHGVTLFNTHDDLVDLITTFIHDHGGA